MTEEKELFMQLGCNKDTPDPRDYEYKPNWFQKVWIDIKFFFIMLFSKTYTDINIKPTVDLREKMPLVYNQGNLGSCTANAIGGVDHSLMIKRNKNIFMPSRLFIYYNEREIEGNVNKDSGASLRNGIKSLAKQGVCPEYMWTYNIKAFTQKPTKECYEEALKHQAIKYERINNESLSTLKYCLQQGNPIIFGFNVYDSFFDISGNGIMPIPEKSEKKHGGHAVIIVGYDDKNKYFIVRNSWGHWWGDKGYFYMPYKYATSDECHDFWVITEIE